MPRVTFVLANETRFNCKATTGQTLLEVAWEYKLEVEGACGGLMACSTCHVIVAPEWLKKLNPPSVEECSLLDLTWGCTKSSRLGCQITLTDGLDGLVVELPPAINNILEI